MTSSVIKAKFPVGDEKIMDYQMKNISILGVKVNLLTVVELHSVIDSYIAEGCKAQVLHVNVHGLNLAYKHAWLRQLLNEAAIAFCDGDGVRMGGRLLGYDIPQRITYADWMWQLCQFAESKDFTLFFLGAKPGVAEKAAKVLCTQYPSLSIMGVQHGYFDKTPGCDENESVINQINHVKPNILIIGFGMPLQEQWLMENWDRLDINIALTGGAVFDYVAGELQRGPRWMTDNGLEWLARLFIEPHRLWRRYLMGNPQFLIRVFKQWCAQRRKQMLAVKGDTR